MEELCEMSTTYLLLTIVLAIMLFFGVVLVFYFLFSMYRSKADSQSKVKTIYYVFVGCNNILFLFSMTTSLIQTIAWGVCDLKTELFWGLFWTPSYLYANTLLLLIFIMRLKHAVQGSAFHLSQKVVIYYYCIIFILFCLIPLPATAWVYNFFGVGQMLSFLFFLICILMFFFNSGFAVYLFIRKFAEVMQAADANSDDKHAAKQTQETQQRKFFKSVVRRQTMIVSIALTSTMLIGCIISTVWFIIFSADLEIISYIRVLQGIDCIIGIICINIQFEHGKKFFNFCGCNVLEAKMDRWLLLCNKSIKVNINMNSAVAASAADDKHETALEM